MASADLVLRSLWKADLALNEILHLLRLRAWQKAELVVSSKSRFLFGESTSFKGFFSLERTSLRGDGRHGDILVDLLLDCTTGNIGENISRGLHSSSTADVPNFLPTGIDLKR